MRYKDYNLKASLGWIYMRYRYFYKETTQGQSRNKKSHIVYISMKFFFLSPQSRKKVQFSSKTRISYNTSFNRVIWYSHNIGIFRQLKTLNLLPFHFSGKEWSIHKVNHWIESQGTVSNWIHKQMDTKKHVQDLQNRPPVEWSARCQPVTSEEIML